MADIESIKAKLAPFLNAKKTDRIGLLLVEAEKQKQLIRDLKNQSGNIVAQKDWIAQTDTGYSVKIGRAAYPYYDTPKAKFYVDDLDQAREVIDGIIELAKSDDAFKEAIKNHNAKPSVSEHRIGEEEVDRPKRGRKKKAA